MWYCYTNLPPIDNFEPLINVHTYYRQLVSHYQDSKNIFDSRMSPDEFKKTLISAIDHFLKTETPWPECICAFYVGGVPIPDSHWCELYFILKDSNNGTTHIISPIELVQFNEYLVPYKNFTGAESIVAELFELN